jgi:hypothetical protein
MALALFLRAIPPPIFPRVTTDQKESGSMTLMTRSVTKLMLRVALEAAAARIVPLPRSAGAETTAVVRTTEMKKLGRGL